MSDRELMLKNVRLAFADALFEAKAGGDGQGKPAFSCTFIMPKDHPSVASIKAAMKAAAEDKWGAKAPDILKALIAGGKVCLRNGEEKAQYEGFDGNLYVSARSPTRPLIIDTDRSPLTQADGKPYSGCFVNAKIAVWAQDNKFGKRLNAQLQGVQFYKDGDAFGGGRPASVDEFESVEDTEGADGAAPTGDDPFGDMI